MPLSQQTNCKSNHLEIVLTLLILRGFKSTSPPLYITVMSRFGDSQNPQESPFLLIETGAQHETEVKIHKAEGKINNNEQY